MSSLSFDPSTGLTCLSCRVVFANGEVQRDHYKTDWHRYNLQRKVADLPPVTVERFQQKVLLHGNTSAQKAESDVTFCETCNKQFQSRNTYENHLNSKKHKENDVKNESKQPKKASQTQNTVSEVKKPSVEDADDIDIFMQQSESEDDSDGWVTDHGSEEEDEYDYDETKAFPVSSCLFCSLPSSSMEANLEHMSVHHGFFLPDLEYCVDVEGMLHYLGLKVGSGNLCLLCNEKRKRYCSVDACQKHMRDKGHCRLAHEASDMLEYEDFYDYSSMYHEDEEDEKTFFSDGYSLTLPSGARVGHRSLMRYYRQRLRPVNPSDSDKNVTRKQIDRNRVIGQYKALGWSGTTEALVAQRVKDLRFMKRLYSKQLMKLGVKSSKLFKSQGRAGQ